MRFRVDLKRFADEVSWIANLQPAPNSPGWDVELAVSDHVLRLRRTDYDTWLQSEIELDAAEDGRATVSSKLLKIVTAAFRGDHLDGAATDSRLSLRSSRGEASLPLLADNMPEIPPPDGPWDPFDVDPEWLKRSLEATAQLAATAIPELAAVAVLATVGELSVSASDGYRAAHLTAQVKADRTAAALSSQSAAQMARAIQSDARILWSDAGFWLTSGNRTVTTRQVAQPKAVNWEMLRRDYSNVLTANAAELKQAVRNCAALADAKLPFVYLELDPGSITVYGDGDGSYSEIVEAEWDGEPGLQLAFNASYIGATLSGITEATHLEVRGPYRPVIDTQDDGFRLVMPVKRPWRS